MCRLPSRAWVVERVVEACGNYANPDPNSRSATLEQDTCAWCATGGRGRAGTSVGSGRETFALTGEGAVWAERSSGRGRPVIAARTAMVVLAALTVVAAAASVVLPT